MVFMIQKNESGSNNLELLTKNGVYPYDYMNDFNKLKEEGLPSIEKFYSKLTGEDISDSDYNHAKMFGKNLNVKQLGITMIFI